MSSPVWSARSSPTSSGRALPAQAGVLAVASCPGVTDVLLAASSAPHWREAADAVAQPSLTAAKLRETARHPSSFTYWS